MLQLFQGQGKATKESHFYLNYNILDNNNAILYNSILYRTSAPQIINSKNNSIPYPIHITSLLDIEKFQTTWSMSLTFSYRKVSYYMIHVIFFDMNKVMGYNETPFV